jgi:hypothetical protein
MCPASAPMIDKNMSTASDALSSSPLSAAFEIALGESCGRMAMVI